MAKPPDGTSKPSTPDDDLAERARRWAEETRLAQGLPPKISDPTTIEYIATILREGRRKYGQEERGQA